MGRILVVDDDESVLQVLSEVLRDAGYDVVSAFDATETESLLDGVDAALIDHDLGGHSGLDLIARIRSHNPALPVVLMTGDSPARAASLAKLAGACAVLTKPFDIDDLSATLDRAIGPSAALRLGASLV
ncbi:MAG: response regulator [Pseudomonadota bacterium]